MRYVYFLLLLTFFACQSKKEKPEIDYVNIKMFPMLLHPPATLELDLIKKTMIFSGLQQMGSIDAECNDYYEKVDKRLDFTYINLNKEDINEIQNILSNEFINDIKQVNELTIKNKSFYEFDGVYFEFDFLKNNQIYSTEDLLILNESETKKIFQLLKILKKHQTSEINKNYIENVSFYLD